MSRKCAHCEEGLAEWVMSYADMITILMAFFVVMYSMAGNKDSAKELAVLRSLREQFGAMTNNFGELVPAPGGKNSSLDLPYRGGTRERNRNRGGADQRRMPEGDSPRAHAPWPGEPTRIGGVITFNSDSNKLDSTQEQSLKLIAEELGGKPQKIEVRGHTARRPGQNGQDTWDLAYARCKSTMQYLEQLGIDPVRFRLGVAGENEPVSEGGIPSPYAQNSRVEVFMLNEVVGGQTKKNVRQPAEEPIDVKKKAS